MDVRNFGLCESCAEGDYDKCTTNTIKSPQNVVYVLSTFDRWDNDFPWDIAGFVYDKATAEQWVKDGKGLRKFEELKQYSVEVKK